MTTGVIRTERLTLRTPCEADASRIAELVGDYEVSKMLAHVPHPYGQADARNWLAHLAEQSTGEEVAFAVDDGNGLVGAVSFRDLQKTPVIGYWLGRAYWGKGYMSEAVRAALGWLFRTTDHELVISEAMNENPASLKVQEKLGFVVVGNSSCSSLARGESRPATRTELKRDDFLKTQTA